MKRGNKHHLASASNGGPIAEMTALNKKNKRCKIDVLFPPSWNIVRCTALGTPMIATAAYIVTNVSHCDILRVCDFSGIEVEPKDRGKVYMRQCYFTIILLMWFLS